MKALFTTILAVSLLAGSYAQKDTPFDKALFKDKKDAFKAAKKELELGDIYYNGLDKNNAWRVPKYTDAIPHYEKAHAFNPHSAELNFKLGVCYLHHVHKYKSLDYLSDALKLNEGVDPEIHLYLGMADHIQYKFDDAVDHYEKHRATLSQKDQMEQIYEVNKKIEECRVGKKLYNDPIRCWIDNLGNGVNDEHHDYVPFISADEAVLFYTSRRPDTQGGGLNPQDGLYFEDIYKSVMGEDGKWEKSINMGNVVNSKGNDACSGLSVDGNTLFIYSDASGGGDIFVSHFEEGEWTKPKDLGKNINTKESHETSACLSYDGKTLYFVTDKPGGLGKHDIYTSQWDEEKEKWGPAENIGPVINTKYEEEGVFIHPDGKTLYFASQGHGSMGGYDIFYSVFENGVWSKPKNVGYPVNTPDDDVYFVVSASGRTGYFSSIHEDGQGGRDLYKVTFLGPEKLPSLNNEDNLLASVAQPVKEKVKIKKVEVQRSDVAVLKGVVRDEKTKSPLASTIEIIDNETNQKVFTLTTSAKDGKYLVTLPSGKNYGMAVKADGYLFHSENFTIPEASGYREYKKDIDMKRVEVGKTIVLRNIFFDLDKATLRPESRAELERLIKLMNENPTLRIEISGHTDSRGNNAHNQDLSERRAGAVVKYLTEHSIKESRMEYVGHGENKLIYSDQVIYSEPKHKQEELHQQNRRTEFKILSK